MSGEGSSADGEDEMRYAEIRARARRRWPWRALLPGIFVGVSVTVVRHFWHPDGRPRQGGSHGLSEVGGAVVAVVVIVLAVAFLIWLVRRMRRDDSVFSAPATLGLQRGQRRDVSRAVRGGRPNADPVLRRIETESAQRLVVQGRRGLWFLLVFAAGELAIGLLVAESDLGRVFFVAAATMFVGFAVQQGRVLRGATRFLERSQDESQPRGEVDG